jgi:hypothetical protein
VHFFHKAITSLDLQLHAATGEPHATSLVASGIRIGHQRPQLNDALCARLADRWTPPSQGTFRATFVVQGKEHAWNVPPPPSNDLVVNHVSDVVEDFARHVGVPTSDSRVLQWMSEHVARERTLAEKSVAEAKQYVANARKTNSSVRIIIGASGDTQRGWHSTDVNVLDVTRWGDFLRLLEQPTGTLASPTFIPAAGTGPPLTPS